MPFFDPAQQQRLMQQMFTNPQGGPMPPSPQGEGGVGQNAPMLAPSFEFGPQVQGGMPQDLGVEPPDGFNRQVPDIGDPMATGGAGAAMFNDPMSTMPETLDANPANAEAIGNSIGGGISPDARERLIQALISRGFM